MARLYVQKKSSPFTITLPGLVIFFIIMVPISLVLIILFLKETEPSIVEFSRSNYFQAIVALFISSLIVLAFFGIIGLIRSAAYLRSKEEETQGIISNLTDGLIMYDSDKKIYLINPVAEEILGIKAKEVVNQNITQGELAAFDRFGNLKNIFYPTEVKIPSYEMLSHLPIGKSGEVNVVEIDIKKPLNRNLVMIEIPFSLFGDRQATRFIKIIRDITRERLISKVKSEFLSIVAHQLRTPLSGVKWTLRMLLDGDLGALNKNRLNLPSAVMR